MLDGIFDGYITTGDGKTFTVEKANRYFDVGQRPIHFHSIVYADEHITHNRFIKKDPNNGLFLITFKFRVLVWGEG